jgi:hypothetical protein
VSNTRPTHRFLGFGFEKENLKENDIKGMLGMLLIFFFFSRRTPLRLYVSPK